MYSVETAWDLYHKELEEVCWEAHLPLPRRLTRAIIGSWMMKLVFYYTWDKALANCNASDQG